MSTYFHVIPLDLRRLIIINLPFEKAQSYCNSPTFNVSCDRRFWDEYNILHYFIDPEDRLPGLNSFEMSKWVNGLLNEYFKKRIAVNVYSLKKFLKYLNDPQSKTHKDICRYIHPDSFDFELRNSIEGHLLGIEFGNKNTITNISSFDSEETTIPFDSSEIRNVFNRVDEMCRDRVLSGELYHEFIYDPVTKDFFLYLISMIKRKTPYFIPGGIALANYNSEFIENFSSGISRDGKLMKDLTNEALRSLCIIFTADTTIRPDVYREEISQYFN